MIRIYVVLEEGSSRILGYHTINLGMMNVDELKRGAPEHGESRFSSWGRSQSTRKNKAEVSVASSCTRFRKGVRDCRRGGMPCNHSRCYLGRW